MRMSWVSRNRTWSVDASADLGVSRQQRADVGERVVECHSGPARRLPRLRWTVDQRVGLSLDDSKRKRHLSRRGFVPSPEHPERSHAFVALRTQPIGPSPERFGDGQARPGPFFKPGPTHDQSAPLHEFNSTPHAHCDAPTDAIA